MISGSLSSVGARGRAVRLSRVQRTLSTRVVGNAVGVVAIPKRVRACPARGASGGVIWVLVSFSNARYTQAWT